MFALTSAVKVFVALEAVDMRKQFNGLWGYVEEILEENPRSGAMFVFMNKDRNRLKILYWDGTGPWVMAKRLEKGCFARVSSAEGKRKLQLSAEALAMLVGGIDLKDGKFKPWYER